MSETATGDDTLGFDAAEIVVACRLYTRSLADITADEFAPLRRKGTSNDHVRLGDRGLVARVPRFSHAGLPMADNLANQIAGFACAQRSRHTPRLRHVLPLDEKMTRGVLIVDFIDGRAPRLPDDMPAIAAALAALHGLPVPDEGKRSLETIDDPVAATLEAIEAHAVCLPDIDCADDARAALDDELAWARSDPCAGLPALSPRFVVSDAHPGNFLIDAAGRAWFTDLEKAHYGAVPIDLAHASLPTSTGWDPDVTGTLTRADIEAFHAAWRRHAEPALVAACAPWWLPLRRLTWLRTMTFMARWQTDWATNPAAGRRDAAMDRHIEAHIARCFEPATIAATRAQWLGSDPLELAGKGEAG